MKILEVRNDARMPNKAIMDLERPPNSASINVSEYSCFVMRTRSLDSRITS